MIASIDDTSRFAEKPPAIPANATTAPATGDRPHAAYRPAARGGTTTNPESAPMCDMNAMVSTVGVSSDRGITPASQRIAAWKSPVLSATPMPIMHTSTTPSGGKLTKFRTRFDMSQKSPSEVSRLWGVSGAPRD